MTWQDQDPKINVVQTADGTIQIMDSSQPAAPVPAKPARPDEDLHWGFCTHGPCTKAEGGGVWFLVEDGRMYGYHKPHLPESDVAECEALRTVYAEKYISA